VIETVWFTGDTHFGHRKMVELRGFDSKDDMDHAIIERWNARVDEGDTVWHLGDFSFYNRSRTEEILWELNGSINIVWGNHDHESTRKIASCFESDQYYKELKIDGQLIVLSHYPFLDWNGAHKGSWHLHGHEHGNMADSHERLRLDVGADAQGLAPVAFEEVASLFHGRAPTYVGHHDPADAS
jgi:calcineurin-like phosphoesterase family protein